MSCGLSSIDASFNRENCSDIFRLRIVCDFKRVKNTNTKLAVGRLFFEQMCCWRLACLLATALVAPAFLAGFQVGRLLANESRNDLKQLEIAAQKCVRQAAAWDAVDQAHQQQAA